MPERAGAVVDAARGSDAPEGAPPAGPDGSGSADPPWIPLVAKEVGVLYDESVLHLQRALVALEALDLPRYGSYLGRTRGCLSDLHCHLDIEGGGALARDLSGLYRFLAARLTEAHVRRDPEIVEGALRMIESLRQGWRAAAAR